MTVKAIFTYPATGLLPAYRARSGGPVEICGQQAEEDYPLHPTGRMVRIRTSDGWKGHAFQDELRLTEISV